MNWILHIIATCQFILALDYNAYNQGVSCKQIDSLNTISAREGYLIFSSDGLYDSVRDGDTLCSKLNQLLNKYQGLLKVDELLLCQILSENHVECSPILIELLGKPLISAEDVMSGPQCSPFNILIHFGQSANPYLETYLLEGDNPMIQFTIADIFYHQLNSKSKLKAFLLKLKERCLSEKSKSNIDQVINYATNWKVEN